MSGCESQFMHFQIVARQMNINLNDLLMYCMRTESPQSKRQALENRLKVKSHSDSIESRFFYVSVSYY